MSNRHLPAGQSIHQGGPGGVPGVDMGGAPGGGPRRRQPQYMPQYQQQQQQQQQQHMGPMYPNYVPYAPQGYYGMPPQFQNGGMPSPGYMPYQNYARSPPSMHQYVPMVGVSVPPNYPRPAQHSPSLSTPYQPAPAPAPIPPQTPSSTHSSQMLPPPTPPTPQIIEKPVQAPPPAAVIAPQQLVSSPIMERQSFRPPLPWLSRPDATFPTRAPRSRRRRKPLNADSAAVSLPTEQHGAAPEQATPASVAPSYAASGDQPKEPSSDAKPTPPTPMVDSVQRSEADGATAETATQSDGRPTGSAVPVTPALPRPTSKSSSTDKGHEVSETTDAGDKPAVNGAETVEAGATVNAVATPPIKVAPTSWANLFAKPSVKGAANSANGTGASLNGGSSDAAGAVSGSAFSKANANSLAEAIRAYRVDSGHKISFLEPRGLINTGNMCYMNSVLQVLMFCVPFYDFLGQVSKRAIHSFKSDTPLVDAMIMFMHEYKVLASRPSADQLRHILKSEDLEKYGEPFTPEFVYEAIRQLSRFASMRRGHQQDAEEFLGFLLQSLDDECTHVMSNKQSTDSETGSVDLAASQSSADPGDWLEVGRKQRAAVTRSSGSNSSTPINKIFGGLLRSEFRVPGLKDSITTEPYQPLQLDIGSPDIRNVVDALRGLTRPERLQGDFNSPRGKDVVATKQVFIESLPPVLILHLKRFQFDAEGHGTIKIWKKVGYPLELEIPREALSRQTRQTMGEGAMPKYKLISVVYHHGKNASGGHYTVDVRRQDGREWIRMDDTVLRRVRSEDVAEGGSEEEVKEVRKENTAAGPPSANRFGAINDEDTGDEDGWKQVTASAGGNKRWSSVVNGTSNGAAKEKQVKESIKDNKVAYLLFYQRV
ncbi:putative ubiquitin carboxyl-terminal hydrolase 3 [Tolypocladium ophioglossoides CBS 100239]|uniref:Ubiquitin carboxyl-terminal hydrolase n=1 Tax=Tolypocladium ophioglossoides (strain CBS 100239) TaxID=1163406 RepID=A0A0L0N2V3_TOLOC|nr:putative ubiquitin carboxyl-terminal hydrolase 3 [Tolypocladium ophioglossoides CBS 100239]